MEKIVIAVEGYLDYMFIEKICEKWTDFIDIDRSQGITNVAKQIRKNNSSIAFVDKVKSERYPDYFKQFILENDEFDFQWKSLINENKCCFLFDIHNMEIEDWLYQIAKKIGLNLNNLKLPDSSEDFKKITKHESIIKNNNVIGFLNELFISSPVEISYFKEYFIKSINKCLGFLKTKEK